MMPTVTGEKPITTTVAMPDYTPPSTPAELDNKTDETTEKHTVSYTRKYTSLIIVCCTAKLKFYWVRSYYDY